MHKLLADTSLVTIQFAPILLLLPIFTLPIILAPHPIYVLFPILGAPLPRESAGLFDPIVTW